ncbi:MAG: hypothetical protein GX621_15930 [Pirellulaceae bacterium]|nr:hypothetical protein [Pirellulaceae bacterium]
MKSLVLIGLVAAIGALSVASMADAQYYGYPSYHASTAGEGYARGMADVVRSRGAANLMDSQAVMNMTQADRQLIDNDLARTQAYFEIRRIKDEAAAAKNQQNRELAKKRDANRSTWMRQSQANRPRRLSVNELNPVTGELTWPHLLQGPDFANDREGLDRAFASRAAAGGLSYEDQQKVAQIADDLSALLKSRIRDLPARDYLNSHEFLTNLVYESRSPSN